MIRLPMLASDTARNSRRIRQLRTGAASPSRFWRFALLAALMICVGCSGDKTPSGKQQQTSAATSGADKDSAKVDETEKTVIADVVFRGGKVFTVDENQPWAEAVAVKGNKIVYVGDSAGVVDFIGEETTLIDTTDKTVMPGFISTHDHLIASYWTNAGVQLFDAGNMDEYVERIKQYAEANPDHKVIKGIGWSAGKLGRRPMAEELDRAVPDRPAIILDFTVHDAWLNTKAMEAAKINKDTPDSVPGVTFWVRDDDGVPTGCAIEGQWFGAYIASGAWEPETMIRDSIDTLFGIAAKNGTTTFLNPGIVTPNMTDVHGGMESDFKAAMSVLQEMDEAGKLKLRTFAQPFFKNPDGDPDRFIAFASDMRKIYSSDRLGVISLKIHPEGNWIAEVAPFLEPYESGKTGTFNIAPEKIKAIMVAAAKADLDIAIHSDSSGSARAAVEGILAAREANPSVRHAIHHATWIHPDDQQRIIENKIPINTTPNFTNDFTGTDKDALRLLGEERVEKMFGRYPYFARAGVSVSLSADVPSTPPRLQAPLFCVAGAVTLKDPSNPESKPFPPKNEPMSVEQAIRGITIEAAWQLRMEDKIGSLEVGKLADIVVLDGNPLEAKPLEIANIKVSKTMMDGSFTYEADK